MNRVKQGFSKGGDAIKDLKLIPVICSDAAVASDILEHLNSTNYEAIGVPLTNLADAKEVLQTEFPNILIVRYSEQSTFEKLFIEEVLADPWLHNGAIIGISETIRDKETLEKIYGLNLVASFLEDNVGSNLPIVLSVLDRNQHILLQRALATDLISFLSGTFTLANDLVEIEVYGNLLANLLANLSLISSDRKRLLNLTLRELLINALEHGNCNISFQNKSAFLEQNMNIDELVRERCKEPDIAKRRIGLEYTLEEKNALFVITDEGDGFDWKAMLEKAPDHESLLLHGRGIIMARQLTDMLFYNAKGNRVSFRFPFDTDSEHKPPVLLADLPATAVKQGDTIFSEGDIGDSLYYIARGSFEVLVKERRVCVLTPSDIFLGEMSFLLNNRRSATVKALTDGMLIKVSKRGFVKAIREQPHYSLFLSRILAFRLERANALSSDSPHGSQQG